MGYDFSWHKHIDTDNKQVKKTLGIKNVKTIHTEYDMFDGVEYKLYEFTMNGKKYREFVESVITGNGNFREEHIGFYEVDGKDPIFYTERNIGHAGIQCIACGEYDITMKKDLRKNTTKYICNNCNHTSNNEADFFPED